MTAATTVRTGALAALVLTAVWLFWPTALGGGSTYLVTHGNSMEPGFRGGDAAIMRAADGYAVGDVVAYRSETLNTVVMHRIVSGGASGFVTRGDNNDWLDEDQPAQEEFLGRLVLRIPQGGKVMEGMGSPGALAVLTGVPLALLGSLRRPGARRNGRRVRRGAPRRAPAFSRATRSVARQAALASGGVAVAALVATGALLVLPSTQTDTRTLQVVQEGRFSYAGTAVAGTTYPTGRIETGDTVWTKLSRRLTVAFSNAVTGPDLTELQGRMRLDVTVTAADGWTAVLASGPETALVDGSATTSVVVDPFAAAALLSRHYAEIGVSGGSATLAVTPVAVTIGRAGGHPFTAGPPPAMPFSLDATSLRPVGEAGTILNPRTETDVVVDALVPRSLGVLAFSLSIDHARAVAGGVLALALLVFAVTARIGRIGRGDLADQFLVRHAERIVPVAAFHSGANVIEVSDAESLHRVAERFDTVVLHHAGPDEDVFAVRDADATYRFVVPGTPDRRRGKPPVPVPTRASAGPAAPPLIADVPGSLPTAVPPGDLWRRFA